MSALVDHSGIGPVYDGRSKVLLLGTIPSPKSREAGFYYAHPQNRFWPVLARLFDEALPARTEERRAFALRHGIALWDVLESCRIEGASDASIRDGRPNELSVILGAAPVRAVFTTGTTAHRLYQKLCVQSTGIQDIPLPSTSPANARWNLDSLIKAYRVILPYLQPAQKE